MLQLKHAQMYRCWCRPPGSQYRPLSQPAYPLALYLWVLRVPYCASELVQKATVDPGCIILLCRIPQVILSQVLPGTQLDQAVHIQEEDTREPIALLLWAPSASWSVTCVVREPCMHYVASAAQAAWHADLRRNGWAIRRNSMTACSMPSHLSCDQHRHLQWNAVGPCPPQDLSSIPGMHYVAVFSPRQACQHAHPRHLVQRVHARDLKQWRLSLCFHKTKPSLDIA